MSSPWNFKTSLFGILLMIIAAVLIFQALEHHLAGAWFAFGIHPEILEALEQSLEDQKNMADLAPEHESVYRDRFAAIQTLLQRLRILEHNRGEIVRRYESVLLFAFAGTVILLTGFSIARHRRQTARLERLQVALSDLAQGRTDIEFGERRRDTIGRIAMMIERTSQVMARDRRRLAVLKNLSAWQEAARRHAHEIRTPLTGARLELTRLNGLLERESLQQEMDIHQATRSAGQELERLGRFTQEFTSFARLPRPEPKPQDLSALIAEFVGTFANAWPNLELLMPEPQNEPGTVLAAHIDRDMLRQVLVNLCDNSSLALGENRGRVKLHLHPKGSSVLLDVSDNGPGIGQEIQSRLFEPYTTTRGIGEGMGLGLAICKKILLDHDGDLELQKTSAEGTTFRLILPAIDPAQAAQAAASNIPSHRKTPRPNSEEDQKPSPSSKPIHRMKEAEL